MHTNEGRRGSGDGKELCDLMVVFGDDVLLFSDKSCVFPNDGDLNVAWNRWYRRAIEKSAKQLAGAESWLRRFPDRVFLDAACQKSLPIPIPAVERLRVHLIAVAHGSLRRAGQHWDSIGSGSSASLIIDTQLVGREHENQPFRIGWPLESRRFVHVLDDLTLSLLLRELDTISDFVDYLTKKQRLLEKDGSHFLILGEEELLAAYLANIVPGTNQHKFEFEDVPADALCVIGEGAWKELQSSPEYSARARANEISYLWDELIEYQASHMIHGSAETMPSSTLVGAGEDLLRIMASETRVTRRTLGRSIRVGRMQASQNRRFSRCIINRDKTRIYAMLILPYFPEQQSHADYRDFRQYLLYCYCEGALLRFPEAKQIVGIAMEPHISSALSVDFMYFSIHDSAFEADHRREIEERLRKEGLWDPASVSAYAFREAEFPFAPSLLRQWARRLRYGVRTMVARWQNATSELWREKLR